MVDELQTGDAHKAAKSPTAVTEKHDSKPDDAHDAPKPDALDAFRNLVHGSTEGSTLAGLPGKTADGGAKGEDGFEILDDKKAGAAKPEQAKIEVLPSLRKPFDAEKVADAIEQACNGGTLFGAGTDEAGILNALNGLSPAQIKEVDDKFASKHGVKYAEEGKRWGLREEFADELGGADLKTALSVLDQKNQIPEALRANGSDLLKDGSGLKAGETNRVTLADGRMYDVYVPQNAQKPLPVVMMMHGASDGHDMANGRIMEKETGMNNTAEQYGFAVVYAFNEPHKVEGIFGVEKNPATWNMQGRKNFLPTDNSYDDAKYLDRVVADVGARVNVDDTRIGVAGMSDGGRAAEQYVLDRPGKFAALSIMHGTWMEGERRPEAGTGLPTMITHGTWDFMLPFDQGKDGWFGQKGRGSMSWAYSSFIPGTSESRPHQQIGAFKEANACEGEPTVTNKDGVETTSYSADQCKAGEIKQFVVKRNNHAWQDRQNEGGWYVIGMPDRNMSMSEETAKFILSHPLKRNM